MSTTNVHLDTLPKWILVIRSQCYPGFDCSTRFVGTTRVNAANGSSIGSESVADYRPRPLMELRRHTGVNWFVSPICLVDVPSALLEPIVCWYRL